MEETRASVHTCAAAFASRSRLLVLHERGPDTHSLHTRARRHTLITHTHTWSPEAPAPTYGALCRVGRFPPPSPPSSHDRSGDGGRLRPLEADGVERDVIGAKTKAALGNKQAIKGEQLHV